MTDYEAVYGEFKSVTCEWIEVDDKRCHLPSVEGRSYCDHHIRMAFRTALDEEFEKEVESEIEESKKLVLEVSNDR